MKTYITYVWSYCKHLIPQYKKIHSSKNLWIWGWGGGVCVYAQSCLALCSPMDCGCSAHEISRQEYWNKLSFPTPGNLSVSGVKSSSLLSPAWADGFFTTAPPEGSLRLVIRCVLCSVAQSSPTLCDPTDYSPLGPSVHGILHSIWVDYHALLQGIFPTRDQTQVSHRAGRFLTIWVTREAW